MKSITSRTHLFQITEADRWELIQSHPETKGELVIQVPDPRGRLDRWRNWWQFRQRFNNWFSGLIIAANN